MLLHDSAISQVAKLVQMAILTGTDVIDHLRMLTLQDGEDGYLYVESEYEKVFNESIEKMLNSIPQQSEEPSKEE